MKPSPIARLMLLCSVAVIVIATTVAFAILHSDDFDSRARFSLTNHDGVAVSEQTYRGRYMLVFFGFTHCPKICPTQMARLTQVLHRLDGNLSGESVLPVFITVDPERDSVERLQSYLAAFHPRFIGLTGSRDSLARAARSFKAYGARSSSVADDDPARHSSVAYLVDPTGRIVTYIAADTTVAQATQHIEEYLP